MFWQMVCICNSVRAITINLRFIRTNMLSATAEVPRPHSRCSIRECDADGAAWRTPHTAQEQPSAEV